MKIKTKLILIFIVVKLIPLFILVALAIYGIKELHSFIEESNEETLRKSTKIIEITANKAIEDSILALDQKSQIALEIKTKDIANSVAEFLYQRDNDLLFLSSLQELSKDTLKSFYDTKTKDVIIPQEFIYDESSSKWFKKDRISDEDTQKLEARVKENEKYFNHNQPKEYESKKLKLYKEISYIDLQGNEIYKVSSIDEDLKNISKKENTYCKAEEYFQKIQKLQQGEIYVSNVIGEYVGSKVIGHFTKEKAEKMGIAFEPQKYGYAGFENPVGKKFEGIVRFITPRYFNGKKIGYITLALDHRHIMEFTDYVIPTQEAISNYSDASRGNYAFMWDNKGRSISHPRDYFIVGYDKTTGEKVKPWLSDDIAKKIKSSSSNWEEYLKEYPEFEEQSLKKKPNMEQYRFEGKVALDCRYLNFAPQCSDWMNITEDGGYGSFVIFWSNVWKLTTVAAIPYYTGQYGDSKRGFGFVTLGANLDEFHEAAIKTKNNIDTTLADMQIDMKEKFSIMYQKITSHVHELISELTFSTIVMTILVILIALWIANYLTNSISKLLEGTKKFKNKQFSYRIELRSNDEMGLLANAFNDMAQEIEYNIKHLDQEVENKTKELTEKNIILEKAKKIANLGAWEMDLKTMESSWSDNIKRMLGLEVSQPLNTEQFKLLLIEDDWHAFENGVKRCIFDNQDFLYTFKVKHQKDGHTMWFECRGSFIEDRDAVLGTVQDITENKIKEKQISRYVGLIDNNIITSTSDLDGKITHVSEAFCEISGYSKNELIGATHTLIKHEDTPETIFQEIWKALDANKAWKGELKNKKKNGDFYWENVTITPLFNDDNEKVGYTAIKQDITDKKAIEEISITDGLTNIYNRRHFNELFPKIINSAKRNNDLISFLIMDIDHFKQYNDTYGHQKGDEVLVSVAGAIKESLKRADDYCFRLGGEEFGVIFKTPSKEQAIEFSQNIKNNIENLNIEHSKNSASQYITSSLGLVTKNAQDIENYNELYKQADELLYKAKQQGRNRVAY